MKSVKDYSFEDGNIKGISIHHEFVEVIFSKWDDKLIRLTFEGYWRVNDHHSVGQDVSELLISSKSKLKDEVISEAIAGDGTEEEVNALNSYSFISSWGDRILLEIVAYNVKVVDII